MGGKAEKTGEGYPLENSEHIFLKKNVIRSSCCFWYPSPVANFGSVGCVGFLVEGTSACVLVDEAGSCLSGGQVHIWWCVLGCLCAYYYFRQPLC